MIIRDNFCEFCIKTYVVTPHLNLLDETVQMRGLHYVSMRNKEKKRALGPVVQSIISLTSSLRGQLVKGFKTLLLNTLIFLVEKMREAFALQKLLTFFQPKILAYFRY